MKPKPTCYLLAAISLLFFNVVTAQTTDIYTSATTWTVPANVSSISVKVYGGGGGTGGQDCGAGCTNAAAGNAGYVVAAFAVMQNNVVGIYPGAQGANGASAASGSGGGNGGVASYMITYNGGKGGNAGSSGTSGAGGGGGAASVVTISSAIKIVAGGAGGGGGMANQAASGQAGTNTYSANGTSNTGGVGTAPAGDGGGGGGGGGGSFGSLGGGTHAAGSEQAGNGGNIGGNLVSGATTTTTNGTISWTSGGRIEITYTVLLPVTWLSVTATRENNNTILLNWSTAVESQTSSYTVQRSVYGNSWVDVGHVAAAGNSTTKKDYQFADNTVVKSTYYYRLSQIDLDGKINLSKIVICASSGNPLKIFPNPVLKNQATLTLPERSLISVYNDEGKVMLSKTFPAGNNVLDLSNCKPGLYMLKTANNKVLFIVE